MNYRFLYEAFILICLIAPNLVMARQVFSPDKQLLLEFELVEGGKPNYRLWYKGKALLKPSSLGFETVDVPSFLSGFEVVGIDTSSKDEFWDPVWGEESRIRNQYREMLVKLVQPKEENRVLHIRFRIFNDGMGFRYEFPKQEKLKHFIVREERTAFRLAGNHKVFWMPGDYNTNEYRYMTSMLMDIPALMDSAITNVYAQKPIDGPAVQTPLMLKTDDGVYINIHEAALVNYAAMQLELDTAKLMFRTHLTPDAIGHKGYLQTEAISPWRTIIVSDKATNMLASRLILNLNEPTSYHDVSWIKPAKYIGVWWEYFVSGKSTWEYSDEKNVNLTDDFGRYKPNGKHGANTTHVKEYIDFAADNGFDAVLVEGWNIGWEDWFRNWKEEVFDFVTPYPDFDVKTVQEYAQKRGVDVIMHHETAASVTNYERRLDTAFRFMKAHGYQFVKTGYVGNIIPRGEYHDGQWMVNHYIHIAKKAAASKIMVNSHEAVRPTGLHRTYPNWLAQESARGTEFEVVKRGLHPEHTTILPFTRLIGGPMDYTPGIFQTDLSYYGRSGRVNTTLVKQLAYYVTIYSPLQMAADMIENYRRFPDAFQFIKDVAVDWEQSYYLEAEPGDYVTIARKAKNKEEWFVGSVTDEKERVATVDFGFLPSQKEFVATIYADGKDASYDKNPQSYSIRKIIVNSKSILKQFVASGGGLVISIRGADDDDKNRYTKLRPIY